MRSPPLLGGLAALLRGLLDLLGFGLRLGFGSIDFARRSVRQCLVRSPGVVVRHPALYSLLQLAHGGVFEAGKERELEDFSAERTDLHSKIGELTVKLDFVVKKSKQLGVWSALPNSSNHTTRSSA